MGAGHMAFRRFENHIVVVSDSQTPTADEWASYLDACVKLDRELNGRIDTASAIIFTDGGGPDSAQRMALKKLMFGRSAAAAMVSDSLAVRAAVGVIGLFNKGIKGFAAKEWKQAATFAQIPEAQHMELMRVAVSLSHEVTECRVLRAMGL